MIDSHAHTYDVSTSHVVAVDAEPEAVLAGLDSLALTGAVTETIAPAAGRARVYGLAWKLDDATAVEPVPGPQLGAFSAPGYLKVVWDVQVAGDGDGGSYVTTTTRFVATDEAARQRLRSSWRVLGPLSADLARRALGSLKRLAEGTGEPVTYGIVAGFPRPVRGVALPRVA
jgi:hypothetical protein